MATINKFEDLEVWKLARELNGKIVPILTKLDEVRNYGLKSQLDNSAGSVMDNIAEGFERSGNNEFRNFLLIAKGSNGEFRSQLYRCLNRRHITQEQFDDLHSKNLVLGNKIMAFVSYLQKSEYKGQRYKKDESLQPQTSNIKPQT